MPIPFNRASLAGAEFEYMKQAIDTMHVSGNGPFTKRCEQFLERALGVPRVLLTTSCTHALEMAALLLNLQPGDEVVLPSFTFVSTANAFVMHGARPVFVDVRPDTFNLDERRLAQAIGPRTRAVVPVHYAGVGCDMDAIEALCTSHGIRIIEDNAHGLFGRHRGRLLGTTGSLAALSFHETKNFTCGEGGAIVINDARDVARAEILREKGTDRSRFLRGEVDKYTWVDVGSSYVLSDILAAFLLAQFEAHEQIQARRRAAWEFYQRELAAWAGARDIRLPIVPEGAEQPYHMFYLVFPTLRTRQRAAEVLQANQIMAVFHYQPLHASAMGRRFGGKPGDCPVTERAADCLLRLPFFTDITEAELARVVGALKASR